MKNCKKCHSGNLEIKKKKTKSLVSSIFGEYSFQVVCKQCGNKSKESSANEVAIEDWNSSN